MALQEDRVRNGIKFVETGNLTKSIYEKDFT